MFNLSKIYSQLKGIFLTTALFIAVTAVGVFGASDAKAAMIDLGFALDESGSIGSTDYTTAKNALADALAVILTDPSNTYTVGVVSFSSLARTVVAPTVVTAASLPGIQTAIRDDLYNGGGTHIGNAIDLIVADFVAAGGLGDKSLINVTTDGQTSDEAGTTASATAANVAGWDGLSFEAVGGNTDEPYMLGIAFPQPSTLIASGGAIPDPSVQGFVLQVANFADYQAAITAKVTAIVRPPAVPVPAAVWLFGTALLGFIGVSRRRKVA